MASSNGHFGYLDLPFDGRSSEFKLCLQCARAMQKCDPRSGQGMERLERVRAKFLAKVAGRPHEQESRVIISVLFDLRSHGWTYTVSKGRVRISRPDRLADEAEAKTRVRGGHAVERHAQLCKASVRRFVRDMEDAKLGPNGWVSIFSLMRDGRDLAEGLGRLALLPEGEAVAGMRQVIDPYVQVIDGQEECEHTGLGLMDIWRYFRYTWATAYQSVPGRSMMVLIRDRAVMHHPVIGIAALTSPVVQLNVRDRWIGWAPGQLSALLGESPGIGWSRWLKASLKGLIGELHVRDLVQDRLVTRAEIARPTDACIERLRVEAGRARAAHLNYPDKQVHKNPKNGGTAAEWRVRAESNLFRSKRAETLAELLWVRKTFRDLGAGLTGRAWLKTIAGCPDGCKAIEAVRRFIKAIHVGNDVLEISICGAIPPYNTILGGKLIAMLLASPEIVEAYKKRYANASSIIASSMAGRAINRRPQLVALATTSLYGMKLSQYTRISVPANACGGTGSDCVAYKELGLTEGQGSYHLSGQTIDEIELLLAQTEHGRRVNSIFGEGVNPRMRKIRGGLDMCGFPSDHVLMHGNPRVVYGVALASNFREILLGRARRPRYVLPNDQPGEVTKAIGDFWFERWLHPRLNKEGLLDVVGSDTLARPITHRARVILPDIPDEEPLFHRDE